MYDMINFQGEEWDVVSYSTNAYPQNVIELTIRKKVDPLYQALLDMCISKKDIQKIEDGYRVPMTKVIFADRLPKKHYIRVDGFNILITNR